MFVQTRKRSNISCARITHYCAISMTSANPFLREDVLRRTSRTSRQNSIVDSSWKSVNYSRLVLRTNVRRCWPTSVKLRSLLERFHVGNCSKVFSFIYLVNVFRSFSRFFHVFHVPCQWKRIETRYETRGYLVSSVSTRVNQSAHEYTQRIDNLAFLSLLKKFPLLFNLRSAIYTREFYCTRKRKNLIA